MNELFKPATLGTQTGCIAALVVVMNAMRHALDWGPRWFGFLLAIVIASAAAAVATKAVKSGTGAKPHRVMWIAMILLNGCLIYTSAFGLQNSVVRTAVLCSTFRRGPYLMNAVVIANNKSAIVLADQLQTDESFLSQTGIAPGLMIDSKHSRIGA